MTSPASNNDYSSGRSRLDQKPRFTGEGISGISRRSGSQRSSRRRSRSGSKRKHSKYPKMHWSLWLFCGVSLAFVSWMAIAPRGYETFSNSALKKSIYDDDGKVSDHVLADPKENLIQQRLDGKDPQLGSVLPVPEVTSTPMVSVMLPSSGENSSGIDVYIAGDMEKFTSDDLPKNTETFFKDGVALLHGAGNEVISFQVLLRAKSLVNDVTARLTDFTGPTLLYAAQLVEFSRAYYVTTKNADFSWGTGVGALPWKGLYWPDMLIPFKDPYNRDLDVGAPFQLDPDQLRTQALWVDIFIPKDTPSGIYDSTLDIIQKNRVVATLPLKLRVYDFNLPDETHIDVFGELYGKEGIFFDTLGKFDFSKNGRFWRIYQRYIQMGHAHRFLPILRAGMGPAPTHHGREASGPLDEWQSYENYTPYTAPILDGSLFTFRSGYFGPCEGVPPSFFPAPFVEAFYGSNVLRTHMAENGGSISREQIIAWANASSSFNDEMRKNNWSKTRFFAYIFDEVDGGQDTGERSGEAREADIVLFHKGMKQAQDSIDLGTDRRRKVHLLWTSHSDPAQWKNTPAALDNIISWWSPNAAALNLDFFSPFISESQHDSASQTVWFYHHGQPFVGNQSINQTGIDLRTWGLLCARYNLTGCFMWSMMCFSDNYENVAFVPYDHPNYKAQDTRWGNGVLFYPGSRLRQIGAYRNIDGPLSSMRMKALRRGIQDYEYIWLARKKGLAPQVNAMLRELIPAGFSDAAKLKKAAWSQDPEDYYRFRQKIAQLLEQNSVQATYE